MTGCYSLVIKEPTKHKGGRGMLEQLDRMETEEGAVRVDLLRLDPWDPEGGCCCGRHGGGHCCGRHGHGPEQGEG